MSEELKPCPFCGSSRVDWENDVGDDDDYYMEWWECEECGGRAPTKEAWNARVGEEITKRDAEIERLREALIAADAAWEYTDTVTNNMAKKLIEEALNDE